jgi:putative membrane protein
MWWNDMWGGYATMPWMFFGPAMMAIFVVGCIAVLYLMVRGVRRSPEGEGALGMLQERFARGEIDQAEFEQRRRVLLN